MVCSCLFDPTALMTFSDPSQFSVFQVEPRAAVRASATLLTKYAGLDFAAPWKHQSFTRYATRSPSHPAALIKAVFYIFSGLALVSALAFQVTCQPQILLQWRNLKSQNWTTKITQKGMCYDYPWFLLWFLMLGASELLLRCCFLSFFLDLFIQHSVLCQCGSLRFLQLKRTLWLQVAPFVLRHLGDKLSSFSSSTPQTGSLHAALKNVSMTSLRGNKCYPSLERSKALGFLEVEFSSRVMVHCQKTSKVLVAFDQLILP